ncbi:TPA: hypothetical protein QEM76_001946 [Pseudomonas putida]|uniref:coiled-coil domain-containing protein n=1 Tax=Pseudomonas putida TaxID=303 RepID=UPI00235C6D3F|nr:hypothetical protein [Pseudomonas putida]GLO08287.1 hypothetical protein PPUJ20005_22560 [Pseudomonas putida]HDS0983548.1 hypothetical protein [Pseudomonas putida]HDS1800482.1 hypothetical protein [Pseudomonas putida]HDS1805262.1 hypothetical protein [Pseudomonas putida]
MQKGKTSIFKWAVRGLLAVVGAVVLAPFAKWGEDQLNLSLLSPVIDRLSGWMQSVGIWLNQPVPIQMWEFAILVLCVLVALAVIIWTHAEANGKLAALGTELDNASLQLEALDSTQAELDACREKLDSLNKELEAARGEIADLREPKVPPLTKEQVKVIAAIAAFDNVSKKCRTKELPAMTELTLLQTDGALDVLAARKLISVVHPDTGKYATLTARGRAQVLSPEFIAPPLPRLPPLAPERDIFGRI